MGQRWIVVIATQAGGSTVVEAKQDGSILIDDLIENVGSRMIICGVQQPCVPGGALCDAFHCNNRPCSFHRFTSTFATATIVFRDFTETDFCVPPAMQAFGVDDDDKTLIQDLHCSDYLSSYGSAPGVSPTKTVRSPKKLESVIQICKWSHAGSRARCLI
jgi:hypothetical protein